MKKLIIFLIVVVAIIAMAGVGFMFIVDRQVDIAISQIEDHVTDPMTVSLVSDNKSLFEREVVIKVGIDTGDESVYLILQNDIQKRPWGTSIEHRLTVDPSLIASINDAEVSEFLSSNFINDAMLAGHTNISLLGTYQTNLASFSIDQQYGTTDIEFSPWTISVAGNLTGDISAQSSWEGMTVKTLEDEYNQVDIDWKPMSMIVEGKYYTGRTFVGQQTLKGDGINWTLDSGFERSKVEMGAFSLLLDSNVQNDRLAGEVRSTTDLLTIDAEGLELALSDIVFAVNFSGFDINNLPVLSEELNAMATAGNLTPSPALVGAANKALQDGFNVGLPEVSAKLDGKEAKLSLSLSLPANQVADISNTFSLMGLIPSVSAQANLNIHKDIAARPEFSEQLGSLMGMGIFIEDQDDYVFSASFINGAATLNGQPMPLPF